MNYRHAYHAGNHGDVLKHAVLARIVSYLAGKDKPMALLDAHAGIGRYDLLGPEALRTGEWQEGIGLLWKEAAVDQREPLLRPYLDILSALNADGQLRHCCGTPEILARLARPDDRLIFNELHPADCAALRQHYQADGRVRVTSFDAIQSVKAELPFRERRGIVVIDPPYEEKDEPVIVARMLREGLRRMANAVYVVWYPVTTVEFTLQVIDELRAVVPTDTLHVQLMVKEANQAGGLSGSGLVIVNPPWTLHDECKLLLPSLAKLLGKGRWGASTVEKLAPPRV
jgi:23S rRNA (adenine2030-N6)-methyltransferase